MKRIISEFSRIFILTILTTLSCNFKTGFAQQQQNANAYTFWDFGKDANDIENVEQKIWIALPAHFKPMGYDLEVDCGSCSRRLLRI